MSKNTKLIDAIDYHYTVKQLRKFFEGKGFIEVPTQSRLSILAACEDPKTIATIDYNKKIWPLPQTGQMWLEYELLLNPDAKGFFCQTTSYRQEPNPIEGRHETIFPLFEFESKGDFNDLLTLEKELLEFLGFGKKESFPEGDYLDVSEKYKSKFIEHEQEEELYKDNGPVFMLKNFPSYTSPFWNMKLAEDKETAKKCDVILCGMETIGSAERSCDRDAMKHMFETISDGGYAKILYGKFGQERVDEEMKEFLSHNFFKRFGGGIGVTRLMRAMKMCDLIPKSK